MADFDYQVRKMIDKGHDIAAGSSPDGNNDALLAKITSLDKETKSVKKTVDDHENRLRACIDHAKRFHDQLSSLEAWLKFKEDRLQNVTSFPLTKDAVAKQVKEAQVGIK